MCKLVINGCSAMNVVSTLDIIRTNLMTKPYQ